MTELWLKYRDEKGDDRKVRVAGSPFIIGRHSECDLSIPSGKLSRQHVKIEAFAEVFVVSDLGSSNGTTLNGADLREPAALEDGDVLNLGGGVEMAVELASDKPKAGKPKAADEDADDVGAADQSASAAGGAGGAVSTAAASNNSSIPTFVFIAAPALVVLFLLCGGGLLIFSGGIGGGNNSRGNRIETYYPTPDETPENSPTPRSSPTASNGAVSSPSPASSAAPTPEITDEKKKIEINSAAFLQRIAANDPTAFLKSTEIDIVAAKLAPLKGSSTLAQNLKAVKQNASQFESLAQSKGLKPQFLAVAALTEIGSGSGNPLEVAQKMLPIFAELRISLANNLADDNLMMIAAYDQGKAGKFKDLRNALEALAKKNPSVSPREIRTIWFLKRQGKITDAEYEFALRFLAIGTITRNPKDFGVNAEAVIFN
jgi:pSer/pThr/pTyr-binding forkhead associated (FHA) protein